MIYSLREFNIESDEYIVDKSNFAIKFHSKSLHQKNSVIPEGTWGVICDED